MYKDNVMYLCNGIEFIDQNIAFSSLKLDWKSYRHEVCYSTLSNAQGNKGFWNDVRVW